MPPLPFFYVSMFDVDGMTRTLGDGIVREFNVIVGPTEAAAADGSTLEIGTFYVNDTHGNPVRSFYALATESVGLLPRTTAVKYAG